MQRDGLIASEQVITCPHCNGEFPLTEGLFNRVRDSVKAEFAPVEAEFKRRAAELDKEKAGMESAISERLKSETKRIEEEARKKALENAGLEIRALREQKERAQKNELELRKKSAEVDEREKTIELTLEREREKIRQTTLEMFADEHRRKDMEKDKRISDLMKSLEEAKRKAEQGSQQSQGEVMEMDLEAVLRERFPFDVIEPVPKGVRGADIIQRVANRGGQSCGMIVWEAKRTKNWSDGWIQKLKDDQREAKADVAVLVSDVLPRDVDGFGSKDGIWIASPRFVIGVLLALRNTLIQVALAKSAAASKDQTIEALFQYVTGPQFRQRVEASVRAFMKMRDDLEEEKRTTQRRWSKREKQLDMIIGNTSGMYGDLQGLLGTSMQPIPALEAGEEVESGQEEPEGLEVESEDPKPGEDIPF